MRMGTTTGILLLAASCATAASDTNQAAADGQLTATAVVRRCDDLLRGEHSYSRLTLTIRRPEWTRTMSLEAWTRGTEDALIRVLAPAKDRGVAFLKRGREAWQYIPAIDRTIKIPPSMMLQSWMGSDFTNDDVVRADSYVTDYTHRFLPATNEADRAVWLVEGIPKPRAPVVWGRVVFRVRRDGFVPLRVDYYDEDDKRVKYYETSDVQTVEGRQVPMFFAMHDLAHEGHETTLRYEQLTFRPALRPDTFSLRNLER